MAIVILATAATYVLEKRHQNTLGQHKSYAASTEVYIEAANPVALVGANGSSQAPSPPDGQQMSDIATLFTAQSITQAVYRHMHRPLGSAGSVSAGLLSTGSAATYGTSIITLQAISPGPSLAAELANQYVAAFLASRRAAAAAAARADAAAVRAQLSTIPATSSNASERRTLELQVAQLRSEVSNPNPGAYQVSSATPPTAPLAASSSKKPFEYAAIAAVVALLFSIALAYLLNFLDPRLRRVADIEASYRRAVLAVLPHVPRRTADGHAAIPPVFVETMRSLRVALRLPTNGDRPFRTIVVASAVPGEGKSTVASHLALVCAESGERVLLIDADLRRPSMTSWFGIAPRVGLTHVLRGEVSIEEAVVHVQRPEDARHSFNRNGAAPTAGELGRSGGLDVLVHGDLHDNPAPLLATPEMAAMLAAASAGYDVIVVDTAPILAVADAVPLLDGADATLLVARLGVTTRDAAERLREVLARVPHLNLLGVVANDARGTFFDSGYSGGYAGRGGYGYSFAGRRDKTAATAIR